MVRVNKSALRVLTKGAPISLQKTAQEEAEVAGYNHAEAQQRPMGSPRFDGILTAFFLSFSQTVFLLAVSSAVELYVQTNF